MEEAWELAVVSEGANWKLVFNETGLRFLNLNEFALRYHLVRLEVCCKDYESGYGYLRELSKLEEHQLPDNDTIWDVVIECSEALAGIANAICPMVRGKKTDLKRSFGKKRAEALQGLLQIEIESRFDLVDFRNRVHHEDEDFDHWYFSKMTDPVGAGISTKVVRRQLLWGTSPINSFQSVSASCYDAKTGMVHFFEKHYSLHTFMTWVNEIFEKIPVANKRLSEIADGETRVTTI